MNYDIIQAEYLDGYRLRLSFSDGASGEVDFQSYIEKGGVFKVLEDVEQFKQFSIDPDWNTVVWQDGEIDVAPETLYLKATGALPNREGVMKVAETPPQYGTSSKSI